MNYINQYELIKATLNTDGEYLDHKKLLSTVNRNKIIKKIEKIYQIGRASCRERV